MSLITGGRLSTRVGGEGEQYYLSEKVVKFPGCAWKHRNQGYMVKQMQQNKSETEFYIVACVRLHSEDERQWRSEGGGGGESRAQSQRLKEFIGRSSKDSKVSGRVEYLAGDW